MYWNMIELITRVHVSSKNKGPNLIQHLYLLVALIGCGLVYIKKMLYSRKVLLVMRQIVIIGNGRRIVNKSGNHSNVIGQSLGLMGMM